MRSGPIARWRLVAALAAVLAGLVGLLVAPLAPITSPAEASGGELAQADDTDSQVRSTRAVTVLTVSGRLDVILADYIESNIAAAERRNDLALVLQVNSPGTTLTDSRLGELAKRIDEATIPIAAWVGPSGAAARGATAEILALADVVGISPGAKLGNIGEPRLLNEYGNPFGQFEPDLINDTIGFDEVGQIGGPTGDDVATLPGFLASLDGVETEIGEDGRPIVTTRGRAVSLPLTSQLMHTVASPEVSYLLLITGLGLLVFELFTAGVGVAGLVGAGCLVLGSFGIFALPTRWWAIALILFSMFAFSVDIQTGVPRFWSGVGALCFLIGSLFLFDGISMSWITLIVGLAGMAFSMFSGMPSMVRTRFSTPTIGRDWMIGEEADVVSDVAPEGVVRIDGALWKAIANRATPVHQGDTARVVAIDRLVLEVEPLEGAARDYRERARNPEGQDGAEDASDEVIDLES